MLSIGQPKRDSLALMVLASFGAGAAAVAILIPGLAVELILLTAAIAVVGYCALRWEVTLWTWVWVLSYALLDRGFWRLELPGFFNLTIPRILFVVALVAYGLHFILHRRTLRFDRPILWWVLALVVYSAINATAHGWTIPASEKLTPPYYRFIGSLVFPVVMFFLMYNCARREKQYLWALILLSLLGWYAIYIAYLQYAANTGAAPGARAWIWPAYINDPEYGIHFLRSRGPFVSATPQAMFMVVVFFTALFLLRQVRGLYRVALVVQAILVLPAVFFSGLRAGYVALLGCGMIWVFLAGRRVSVLRLVAYVLVLGLATMVFWNRLSQTDRASGGVAQVSPVQDRLALAKTTFEMARVNPWTGVGYGRFAEARRWYQHDPTARPLPSIIMQHNVLLGALAETGVIGVTLLCIPFGLMITESVRLYRKLPAEASGPLSRGGVVLFWVFLANYIIGAMFSDVTTDFFNTGLVWATAGLIVGFSRQLEPHRIDLPLGVPGREF